MSVAVMGSDETKAKSAAAIEVQIGRKLRADTKVASLCNQHLPVVARVPPVLDHGEPFPTHYWLTCPLMVRRVSRVEADGLVRFFQKRVDTDPEFRREFERRASEYADERDANLKSETKLKPRGGVGGAKAGVKCLHAHLADYLAGNNNVIGMQVARLVGRAQCSTPCVRNNEKNSAWSEAKALSSPNSVAHFLSEEKGAGQN